MKKILLSALAASLIGVAGSANAWWGWGPWDRGWGDDFWGDGFFDFNMHAGAGGRGWGRYYDYYRPYWWGPYGGYPYYGWGHPYAYPYAAAPVAPQAPTTSEEK